MQGHAALGPLPREGRSPIAGWYVIGPAALILPLLFLGGGLLRERARRRRAERSLAERVRFERLLADQAAAFSSVPSVDVDQEIRAALRRISDFLAVDWGCLTEYSHDRRTARITHSWVADGLGPQPSALGFDELPWVVRRLQRDEVVRFSRLAELPASQAAVDRRTFLAMSIKSQVAVPLLVEGTVVGALAFSTLRAERVWRDEFIQQLRLLGELFANTLSRRRAEMEGQRFRADLAHVGRVSTMGELTASLAHELNQPLTAILANAEAAAQLLDSDTPNLVEVREILRDITKDDKRASDVIHRLRGLLTKSAFERVVLDINEVVGEVARLVSGDAVLRNVVVRLELAPELPPVWGDRVQLQQVVLNLLLNALDAMPESGMLDRSLVLRTLRASKENVLVSVEDSGTGIDEADLDHIFDPFYTTKPAGMGMGLTISRSILAAHGGRLEARNNPDGGATLSFTVPVAGQGR